MLKSVVALVLVFFLASCGSDSGGSTGPDPDPSVPTSLTVSPSSATLDALGATAQFSAVVRDQRGQTMAGATVTWSSDDTSVLTVSSSGLGTAVAVGDATVKAASGTANGTSSATVRQVAAQVQLVLASDHVSPGATVQASLTVTDARGNPIPSPSVSWTSADPAVATVGDGGLVTGVKPGLVFIKAAAGGLSDSTQVSVAEALQQEQMTILTNASGEVAVFSTLGGGTHLQIVVEDEAGQPLAGASVEYGEGDGKVYLAVRRDGYAPAFVFGTVEELKEFGEPLMPSPGAVESAASLESTGSERVVTDAIRLKIALPNISDAALSVIQGALRIQTFFHRYGPVELGSDGVLYGRKCMTWEDFARLQIARLNSIPGWVDGVIQLIRDEDPSYFDPVPLPGDVDFYFSAQDVVNFLTGEDLLAEKVNLLGAMVAESPTGRMVEVEWDFGDTGPPVRQGLGAFKVRTNDPYCGGAIPDTMYAVPDTVPGPPGGKVQATVFVESSWGNPIPGVEVTFSLATGNGSLPGDLLTIDVTTDENGKATVIWTLPGTIDSYTLTASAEGADGRPLSATITGIVQTTLIPTATSLVTGNDHTCGLTQLNQAYCWGRNGYGELGIGTRMSISDPTAWKSSPEATHIPSGVTFDALTAGENHTCALSQIGKAYCWGSNEYFQAGGADIWTPELKPKLVPGGKIFATLVSGSFHNCGIEDGTGKAYCWGRNNRGQLGDGHQTDSQGPVLVSGSITFESLSAGGFHTCGIEEGTNTAYCWGGNDKGQLGLGAGNTTDQSTPKKIQAVSEFETIAAGWYHTCGVDTDGSAYCWGRNNQGQLGLGSSDNDPVPNPMPITSVSGFTALTAGAGHTCGLAGGSSYCWGRNDQGMLGDASNSDRHSPTLIAGGHAFEVLSAGAFHTCGLTADGTPWCWGDNVDWQLGQGEGPSDFPVDINEPTTVKTPLKFGRPPSG